MVRVRPTTWSDTPAGAYVARPTPVKCVTHAETPHWGGGEVRRKAPVSAIDRVCGTTAGAVVPQPVPVGSGSSTVRRHRARPVPIAGRCGRIAVLSALAHWRWPRRQLREPRAWLETKSLP